MKVGFIGLGAMGGGMVRNLLRAGHAVTAWDREPEPLRAAEEAGATAVARAADAMAGEVVVSMLAHDKAIRAVILDGGALEAAPEGAVHVNCSTVSVAFAKEMAARHAATGVDYVAAPVFGRPDAAAAAQLNFVVAGPPRAVATVEPLLSAMGQKVWLIGADPFQANLVKVGGNLMIAAAIEAMAEATALGQAHGLERGAMLDVYLTALFPSPVYRNYANLITSRRYEPAGFKMALGLKDVRLALEAGDGANVPLPLASLLRDALLTATATGDGDKDWAALADVALKRSGQL